MLFERFLNTIGKLLSGEVLSESESKAIASLDPEKIYVENVRSILGISEKTAAKICDTAVRQGVLKKGVEVLCSNGAVVASAEAESFLPRMVRCWTEKNGEIEEVDTPTNSLRKLVFYRLADG